LVGRVLVVEDQALNREVAQGMLTALGVRSDTAANGQEALQKLHSESFDAVLMDCEMPLMDGLSAARAWREREGNRRRLAVIALTADATPQGRAACLEAGMDDYLAKPYTREALHGALARWLPEAGAGTADTVCPTVASGAPAAAATSAPGARAADPAALLLDPATLAALRALPPRGSQNMLSHLARSWREDSERLINAMERAVSTGDALELARAAHAWRSCNGHLGALGLMRLCRELEACGRSADLRDAPGLLAQVRALYPRVTDELQGEVRRSA
jgi:two-component system, sensor histidine kinase and response regulator